jgi:hypothetical protein
MDFFVSKGTILGIDFLRHFSLMVDAASGQLIDTRIMAAIAAGGREDCPRGGVFSTIGGTPPEYRNLLVEFHDVLNPSGDLCRRRMVSSIISSLQGGQRSTRRRKPHPPSGAAGDCPAVNQLLGLSTTHGEKGRRRSNQT